MIFLHRLGIVLYWVGYVLAVLQYPEPGSSPYLALFVGYGDGS